MSEIVKAGVLLAPSPGASIGVSDLPRFGKYVTHLERLIRDCVRDPGTPFDILSVDAALDGEPAMVARRAFTIDQLRAMGAFFTGSQLACRALRLWLHQFLSIRSS